MQNINETTQPKSNSKPNPEKTCQHEREDKNQKRIYNPEEPQQTDVGRASTAPSRLVID